MERFDPAAPLADEVRSAAHALAAEAAEALRAGGAPGRAVHIARRRCKQTRALVRMIERPLGRSRAAHENTTLREIGRRLSGMRDADAVVATAERIAHRRPALRPMLEPFNARLQARRDELWIAFAERDRVWVLAELDAFALRADRWPLEELGWSSAVDGIARSFRRGRDSARAVAHGGSSADVHELRKRTKDVRYQIELVRDLWRPVLGGTAEGLRELVDELGVFQDLRLLDDAVRTDGDPSWSDDDRASFAARIHERLADSRRRAERLAGKVYAEEPKAFARRLRTYARDPASGSTRARGDVITLPDAVSGEA